ncbi:hypothetical protein B9Z55_003376 [Caenorhabditis nigoni]|uniref:DUF7154 domain-containing protein n=1 Tax=Caenorhabditis nigoni TaxID=1611254 RepID=A0A2G5VQ07_9PELO|nr:hypothetical protein B9Z55_003376 [Caenorhabditis nigoni]
MDIKFHTNINDVTTTIQNNLPDPNLGFQNSSIGSNVFDVIEKFFSNTQAPVCGSRILILLKRYPNEADSSRLVSLIRYHHAVVHVMTSATPSGGSQPKTMTSVASKTNGMGAFEYDYYFPEITYWFPLYNHPYPAYATTIQVSGSGTRTLPDFHISASHDNHIAITVQDHVSDDSLQKLILRWTNPDDSGNYTVGPSNISTSWHGGSLRGYLGYLPLFNYSMSLDYDYSGHDVQNLQIRIYSLTAPSNWLPYSD